MDTYVLLQHYWWFVVSLLAAILVFLLFVQGGNSLLLSLPKTEAQRKMMVNSTGRKWEFYLYHPSHIWWWFLCLLPVVLQHKFRRGLLAVDDYSL